MLSFLIYFLIALQAWAQNPLRSTVYDPIPPVLPFEHKLRDTYRLCTYNDLQFLKCNYTINVAKNNSIPLHLDCVQERNLEECIHSVWKGTTDMVVLRGHAYPEARFGGLRPIIYAREDYSNVPIAVAPRNLTVVDLQEAPISFDEKNYENFLAALFFNLQRGHDVCGFTKIAGGPSIRIVDSASYEENDNEILICPNRLWTDFTNYRYCNVEAELQRAVFVRSTIEHAEVCAIRQIFNTILHDFGSDSLSFSDNEDFNFFASFMDHNNVIFRNNTIAFDADPTYRNGVNENIFFHYLHCGRDSHHRYDHKHLF